MKKAFLRIDTSAGFKLDVRPTYLMIVKKFGRLHDVSLTSNVEQAHKRKGDETMRQEPLRKWT